MKTMTQKILRQKIFFALGTVNVITYRDNDCEETINKAVLRVKKLHDMLSAFDENSDIGRINKNAGAAPVRVSEETLYLISASIMYSELTNGMSDITTRVLSKLWKSSIISGIQPLDLEVKKAAGLVNYRDINVDKKNMTVMLRRKGQAIDLGAAAKGFAADEVRKIFESEGINDAVINLGGTVIALGKKTIGLQDPFKKTGEYFGKITLKNKAAVTSGTYEQCRATKDGMIHHIIDPKTGYPAKTELSSVTLIGDNAEELDALATFVLMNGIKNSIEILRAGSIEAVFVTEDGKIFTTEGIRDALSLINQ